MAKYLNSEDGHDVQKETIQTSAGAADADKMVSTDAAGKLDLSVMPVGIAPDTVTLEASEALGAGDLVNLWSDAGTMKVRLADASAVGKEAHGFVIAAVAAAADAVVYQDGSNAQVTGLTPGQQWLSNTTPGGCVSAAPSGAGEVVQKVGVAASATLLSFEKGKITVLA